MSESSAEHLRCIPPIMMKEFLCSIFVEGMRFLVKKFWMKIKTQVFLETDYPINIGKHVRSVGLPNKLRESLIIQSLSFTGFVPLFEFHINVTIFFISQRSLFEIIELCVKQLICTVMAVWIQHLNANLFAKKNDFQVSKQSGNCKTRWLLEGRCYIRNA